MFAFPLLHGSFQVSIGNIQNRLISAQSDHSIMPDVQLLILSQFETAKTISPHKCAHIILIFPNVVFSPISDPNALFFYKITAIVSVIDSNGQITFFPLRAQLQACLCLFADCNRLNSLAIANPQPLNQFELQAAMRPYLRLSIGVSMLISRLKPICSKTN